MPTPATTPSDEADAVPWIIAIVLVIAAIVIGAGAMVYRSRIAPSDEPDVTPPDDVGPEDDGEDGGDEDTDEPEDDDDEYETLTIDMPRRTE